MGQLLERLQGEMVAAMKSQQAVRRDILKVVISEVKTNEVRQKKELTDDQVLKIVGKIIENNSESLRLLPKEDHRYVKLTEENVILVSFMPKTISHEETFSLLESVDAIKNAKSDGQATGEAVKFLKGKQVAFDNKVVSEVVKQIRCA